MSAQYMRAATMVEQSVSGRRTLRSFLGGDHNNSCGKTEYLLAIETLKYRDVLKSIFRECGIEDSCADVREGLLLVMGYELLFGRKKISGGGHVKRVVMTMADDLRSALSHRMTGKTSTTELLNQHIQDYNNLVTFVRVNTLKVNVEDATAYVRERLPNGIIPQIDDHIPSLFRIPAISLPDTGSFGNLDWVMEGKLIIQDKASCFPSQVLADCWSGGDLIDACAAPGNKTNHLASLINEKTSMFNSIEKQCSWKVFAFDKSRERAKLLRERMQLLGSDRIVNCAHEDFLLLDAHDSKYAAVSCILLDPSCSGSGVVRSFERVVERELSDKKDIRRINNLKLFQVRALAKALSFPHVKSVVYSTCSVHAEENEEVVAEVLCKHQNFAREWQLETPHRLRTWHRRGLPHAGLTSEQSAALVRCSPEDGTNGFFVALFRRSGQSVEGSYPAQDDGCKNVEKESLIVTEPSKVETSSQNRKRCLPRRMSSNYLGTKRFKVSKQAIRKHGRRSTKKK